MPRHRGRPVIDDTHDLERVADLLVSGVAKTPRSAIARTVGARDSAIRRLQRKWRVSKNRLLTDARERQMARELASRSPALPRGIGLSNETLREIAHAAKQAQRIQEEMQKALGPDIRRQIADAINEAQRIQVEMQSALGPDILRQIADATKEAPQIREEMRKALRPDIRCINEHMKELRRVLRPLGKVIPLEEAARQALGPMEELRGIVARLNELRPFTS